MHIDWGAAATIVVFVLALYVDSVRKHSANLKAWNRLIIQLEDRPLHCHTEQSGPLTVSGIWPNKGKAASNAER